MPYDDPESDDPHELVGVELPGDETDTREMAAAFADEFAQLGFTREQILARMLRNLKAIFLKKHELLRALVAVQRILVLEPGHPAEVRDRGVIYAHLECYRSAERDLGFYLSRRPDADDVPLIRRQLEELADTGYNIH